jgi:hypothetical protein
MKESTKECEEMKGRGDSEEVGRSKREAKGER